MNFCCNSFSCHSKFWILPNLEVLCEPCVCVCVCDRSKDMINRPVGSPRGRIVKIIDEVGVNKTPLPIHTHRPLLFTPPMNMPPSPNWIWKPAPLGCSSPSNELLCFPFRCFPFLPPPKRHPRQRHPLINCLWRMSRGGQDTTRGGSSV